MDKLILVAGSTGGVGQIVVQKLVARGLPVLALARNSEKASRIFGESVEIMLGDVCQPAMLATALQGVRFVVSALGTRSPVGPSSPKHIDYEGQCNLVAAAQEAGVEHFVMVSSIAVTRPYHPLNAFGKVLTWKSKGEACLRQSGIPYTIIRPGGLTDEAGGLSLLQFDQGDRLNGMISRADVAEVCVQALSYAAARNVTFEVIAGDGRVENQDWGLLFAGLTPDSQA